MTIRRKKSRVDFWETRKEKEITEFWHHRGNQTKRERSLKKKKINKKQERAEQSGDGVNPITSQYITGTTENGEEKKKDDAVTTLRPVASRQGCLVR